MPTTLTAAQGAKDKSTIIITCQFADEDETTMVPNSVVWKLMDTDGTVINSRNAESETPATTVNIVLSGDDLAYADDDERVMLVEWFYDSSYGTNLPGKDTVKIPIADLLGVT